MHRYLRDQRVKSLIGLPRSEFKVQSLNPVLYLLLLTDFVWLFILMR